VILLQTRLSDPEFDENHENVILPDQNPITEGENGVFPFSQFLQLSLLVGSCFKHDCITQNLTKTTRM
jgi:hypothetical protein